MQPTTAAAIPFLLFLSNLVRQ